MARNRKRRRTRPPGTNPDPHQGLPTATHDFGATDSSEHEPENGVAGLEPVDRETGAVEDDIEAGSYEDEDLGSETDDDREGAPPPLEHAMPDGELAEEQLEVGRPAEPEPDEGEDEEEYEREVEESIAESGGGRRGGGRRRGGGYDGGGGAGASGGGELAAPSTAAVAERHPSLIARFIGFLQGSWRELQRVQWPDRRQVFQATGVVIGFVIVAAVFLGVADWVSGKLVTFVLK